MIESYPSVEVVKSPCLVYDEEDVELVAEVLYKAYQVKLASNPDVNYNANSKYTESEVALQALAPHKNVFVGTVDYGDMLFWPLNEDETPQAEPNETCVYSKLMKYCADNNLQPE